MPYHVPQSILDQFAEFVYANGAQLHSPDMGFVQKGSRMFTLFWSYDMARWQVCQCSIFENLHTVYAFIGE
jgi:hypothetical protein